MLLEVGEENAAVLLARSTLPDELDTEHDLEALLEFGLARDELEEVARLAVGGIEPDDVNTRSGARRDGQDHLAALGAVGGALAVVAAGSASAAQQDRDAGQCRGEREQGDGNAAGSCLPCGCRTATSTVTPP